MWPPTPTPIPPGAPLELDFSSVGWRMWDTAPHVIQLWHNMSDGINLIIQIVVLLVILILSIGTIIYYVKRLTNNSVEEE